MPDSSVSLDLSSSVSHWRQPSEMLEHFVMHTYPASDDPLVRSLQRLLEREGGHIHVSDETGIGDQSLYQIAYCKPDSRTGKPKGVGPSIRRRLTKRYPDWLSGSRSQPPLNPRPASRGR